MKLQIPFIQWRFNLLIFFIVLLISGLIIRMVDLAIFEHEFLKTQGDARTKRVITSPAFRGMITDRDGYPLAISTPIFSIWMNPQELNIDSKQIKTLSQLLDKKSTAIKALIERHQESEREFVYLKRDVPPHIAKKIKSLQIQGIYLQQDFKRFYPEGEITAHVIGFTNVDDRGQEGIELAYDDWLLGTPGKQVVIKDRKGRVVSSIKNLQEKKSGKNLALSINRRIQNVAYRELQAGIETHHAESGSLVVLDVKTGEILAMVNSPSFNPNNRAQENIDAFRNRAVTDVFEPGSTIKAFSIASALDSKKFDLNTVVDTQPGWIRVGRNIVKDEHNNGPLTVMQIIQKSSNVGTTKIVLSSPPQQLWGLLHRVGFGEITGIGFPGERSGELVQRDNPFAVATLAFGYGLTVTTLQLAQAYAIIANHGMKIPLTLMNASRLPSGKRVMDQRVADQMLTLLESVMEKGGTGREAIVKNYRVAGKTGTSEIAGEGGYSGRYISSFVGIAPASHPRFVVAVVLRDPQGSAIHGHHGGHFAGPIFKKVMESTLHLYNIPPDNIQRA